MVHRIDGGNRDAFVMLDRKTIQSPMSLAVRGLWALCLSYPSRWNFYLPQLAQVCQTNEAEIEATLNQLKSLNLAHDYWALNRQGDNERGWHVFETPALCTAWKTEAGIVSHSPSATRRQKMPDVPHPRSVCRAGHQADISADEALKIWSNQPVQLISRLFAYKEMEKFRLKLGVSPADFNIVQTPLGIRYQIKRQNAI